MLILPLKPPKYLDLQTALAAWLDSDQEVSFATNNDDDPPLIIPKPSFPSQACRHDLMRVHALRKSISNAILKPHGHKAALEENPNLIADLCEYHAALLELEQRGFPSLDDENNNLPLTWKAAFAPQKETHHTLVWDRACCYWNLAALYSQQVEMETSRGNDVDDDAGNNSRRDAYKQGIHYCQLAAGLLQVLQELVTNGNEDYATVDMSKPMLLFWHHLFLAQAQSLVYKMVDNATNSKHGLLAQLQAASHKLWNEALAKAQDPRLQSEVPAMAKQWGAYCKSLSMMAAAKAEYHQAVVHRQAQEWGPELARLKTCLQKLESCHQFVDAADTEADANATLLECQREVKAYLPFVKNRYQQALDDNAQVYQDEVPHQVDDVPSKQLAKATATLPANMTTPKVKLFVGL